MQKPQDEMTSSVALKGNEVTLLSTPLRTLIARVNILEVKIDPLTTCEAGKRSRDSKPLSALREIKTDRTSETNSLKRLDQEGI